MYKYAKNKIRNIMNFTYHYRITYFIVSAFYLVQVILKWPIVQFSNAKDEQKYSDLQKILSASKCFKKLGLDIYHFKSGSCSYNYGESLIRIFNFLKLSIDSIDWLGPILIIATIFCFVGILQMLNPLPTYQFQLWSVLLFCSPPVMLLFERGNLDSLVFCVVSIGILVLKKVNSVIGEMFMALSATFKFYSFPGMILNLFLTRRSPKYRMFQLLLITGSFYLIMFDLIKIFKGFSIPNPTSTAFGSPIVAIVINKFLHTSFSKVAQLLIGIFILFAGLIFLKFFSRRIAFLEDFKARILELDTTKQYIFLVFTTIYLFSFFTSMNFVYRLIFIIPVCMIIFLINQKYYFMNIVAFTGIWCSYEIGMYEILGDIALFMLAIILTWVLFARIKMLPRLINVKLGES